MRPRTHQLAAADRARWLGSLASSYGPGVLLIFALLGFIAATAVIMERKKQSLRTYPTKKGEARVVRMTFGPGTRTAPVIPPIFHLAFRGREYKVQGESNARVGDTVEMSYREDPGGDVLVETIERVTSRR